MGQALLEDEEHPGSGTGSADATASGAPDQSSPALSSSGEWHETLRTGLRTGVLTSVQFNAIRRGLGDPPQGAAEAWAPAAAQLIDEASHRTVEELGAAARALRDLFDPKGAEARFAARYERRSFRTWFDDEGVRHASAVFDDEGGAFLETILAVALRPRRGGPRFVDADENARAEHLAADPRTNQQLSHDLLLDLVRAHLDSASAWPCATAGVGGPDATGPRHTAKHITSTNGRTDVDRGILLCRFHHMQLHHRGWRITRAGTDEFVLHDPGGGQTTLRPRLAARYAWRDIDPPPRRFAPAA